MRITAFLCDHAQVSSDAKLYVAGANINRFHVASAIPPLNINVSLAALIHIPWDQTNKPHQLRIELVYDNPDGAERVPLPSDLPPGAPEDELGVIYAEFNAGRGPEMVPGEESMLPVALNFSALQLPAPGSFYFRLAIPEKEELNIPFRVQVINQFQMFR